MHITRKHFNVHIASLNSTKFSNNYVYQAKARYTLQVLSQALLSQVPSQALLVPYNLRDYIHYSLRLINTDGGITMLKSARQRRTFKILKSFRGCPQFLFEEVSKLAKEVYDTADYLLPFL